MARLVIIEAPGKARTLEALLQRVGMDARVQATKGHLFDMPERLEVIGIDRSLRDFERKPRDMKIVERLRQEAQVASDVVIATDADAEGDVIAWDVAELIRDIHPTPMRARLKGMDEESLRLALDQAVPVRKEDAIPGRTRAIIDRLIGAGFSRNGVAVGRVGTAILGLVARDNPSIFRLSLTAPAQDGKRPWSAEADLASPVTREIALKLTKLEFPALMPKASRDVAPVVPHMGDILVNAGDKLDISPGEAAKSLQRLYEGGRMSYPRAGARGITPAIARKVADMLKKAGYRVNAEGYPEKPESAAHDAPHPIGKIIPGQDPAKLGHDEGVRAMVARDLVKPGQKQTEELPELKDVIPFLMARGFSVDVADAVAAMPWRRETGPRYPGQETWPDSQIIERRADTVLVEKMVAAGLGRPSTWANHAEQFVARGLVDAQLQLTEKGRDWIAASPRELLDPRVSAAIEAACERYSAAMLDDPSREPWERNAERILQALPEGLRGRIDELVANEAPRPKVDPLSFVESGIPGGTELVAEAEARAALPVYAPRRND